MATTWTLGVLADPFPAGVNSRLSNEKGGAMPPVLLLIVGPVKGSVADSQGTG